MKNLIYIFIIIAFVFASCGKKDDVKKEEKQDVNIFKDLVYTNLTDMYTNSATGFLAKKQSKDTSVYTMEIKYKSYNEGYVQGFKESTRKIGKYPVLASNDETGIRMEIMLPNEIYVMVQSYPDYVKEFRNETHMEKMITLFDLESLEKLNAQNINSAELAKHFPKFEKAF